MNKDDVKYKGYKVSPGAQLYVKDLEQQIGKLEELIYKAIKDIDSAKYGEGYQFNLPFISAELKQALKK